MTWKAAYQTIRITAILISHLQVGRLQQLFFNLLLRFLIKFVYLTWCLWWNSGDHDMLVPFLATQDWIRSLNYSIIDHWRPWLVHNQVAGYYSTIFFFITETYMWRSSICSRCRYTKTYADKMTFATVKASLRFSYYLNEKFIVGRVSHFL